MVPKIAERIPGFFRVIAVAGLLLAPLSETVAAAAPSEPQVTVEGRRAKLQRRVQDFVAQITAGPPDTSLQRWRQPICPLIAGLSVEQGEAALARLSQIAKRAGAPLAPKHCKANLVVVVTTDPPAFIEAWRTRSEGRIFNGAAPMVVRHFIEASRPVRVWYNAQADDQNGVKLPAIVVNRDGIPGMPADPLSPVYVNTHADDTRIDLNQVDELTSVVLIVDAQSIQHLKLAQVADYVGMVGLGKLDREGAITDAPTILNLFTRTDAQTAPAGLTDWDEAFLRALYRTSQSARLQRSAITRSVVQDLGRSR